MVRALKIISDTIAYFFSVYFSVLFYSIPVVFALQNINYFLIIGGLVFFIASIHNYKGYETSIEFSQLRETTALIRSALLMLVVSIFSLFILQIPIPEFLTVSSRFVFAISLVIIPVIFRKLSTFFIPVNNNKENVLLIGLGVMGKSFLNLIKSRRSGFNVLSILDDRMVKGFIYDGIYVFGGIDKLESFLVNNAVDRIVISIRNLAEEKINYIQSIANKTGTQLNYLPSIESFTNDPLKLIDHAGIQLVTRNRQSQSFFYKIGKRTVDIVLSLVGFCLSLPFWLFIPIMIKKDSPGPVLFKQKRVGLKEKPFELYKFRSMFIDSSKYEYCPTGTDDPRVTKTGRWLRKISLDELPQLINILKGHMSIVGPRPEMQFIVDEYNDVEKKRLLVKPGLTGLWQISRHRSSEITHNMEYDFYYIENQGFVLDFVIIIMTLFFVVRGITH